MRRWIGASVEVGCGFCGHRILVGESMQLIEGEWGRPKIRCQKDADGPVNESEVAEEEARRAKVNSERSLIKQPTTYLDADRLPFDGKTAAAGGL